MVDSRISSPPASARVGDSSSRAYARPASGPSSHLLALPSPALSTTSHLRGRAWDQLLPDHSAFGPQRSEAKKRPLPQRSQTCTSKPCPESSEKMSSEILFLLERYCGRNLLSISRKGHDFLRR